MHGLRIVHLGGGALLSALVLASAVGRAEETSAAVSLAPRVQAQKAKVALPASPGTARAVDLEREALRREIGERGLVALVRAAFRDDKPSAPATTWERARSVASASTATPNAAMWAEPIDEAFAPGGLQLTKVDDGGPVGVLELGRIATIGHGDADDDGGAFEGGRGHVPGVHEVRAPILRAASAPQSRVPPETIQRVVRQTFGRFRVCYESALRTNPLLEGRVAVKFTIDPTGAVAVASDGGSDLPDARVVACVVRAFASLTFPEFSAGVVTVIYPLRFTPEARPIAPRGPARAVRP
jgi:hypothetical protein